MAKRSRTIARWQAIRRFTLGDSRNRILVAGILVMAADTATILSGAGMGTALGDPFRIGAGAIGGVGTILQILVGSKPVTDRHAFLRSLTALKIVFLIKALAAASLIVSGLTIARYSEAVLGFWIALAFLIKALVREKGETITPALQAGMPDASAADSRLAWAKCLLWRYAKDLRGKPIRLGSDMLSVTALLVVLEAIYAADIFRFATGLLLMASNLVFRDVRKSDFS